MCLILIKILGYKLIWTVHNIISYEEPFANDHLVRIFLSKLCDAKIVHSEQNLIDMKKLNFDVKNSYVIPIGNYIDVYKNSLTKIQSRKILNLRMDNYVILCFGRVEPYKGIDDLIGQFNELNLPKTVLHIVGPCSDNSYKQKLQEYTKDNTILKLEFIADEDVQVYFNAADIVACPFKRITTSSSAILALSFAKPVIAPLIGNIVDIPNNAGFFYNLGDKAGLKNAILKSFSNRSILPKMADNAFRYVRKQSWNKIANQTYEVYEEVSSN